MPHNCTLPARSACWAWMIDTSGLIAGTAVNSSPVNGQAIVAIVFVCLGRSVPTYPRSTPNGNPDAPAT